MSNRGQFQIVTMAKSATITGTTSAPDEPSNFDTRGSVNGLHILNLLAYVINLAVTYLIGVVGILGQPTNQDLSLKYQTLVTPIGWSFSIWGVIFLAQLVWAIYQMASRGILRNSLFVTAIGRNYALVVLFQVIWTVSFSYEIMWLSIMSISLLLVCLWNIVDGLERIIRKNNTQVTWIEYILWFFPFTIHCGWITVATVLNYNVILVSAEQEYGIQYYAAVFTEIILVGAAMTWLLRDTPEYVIPLVLAWAGVGIYFELADPVDAIADNFEDTAIRNVKNGAILVTGFVMVGCIVRNLITLCCLSAKQKTPEEEKVEEGANYTRAEF